MRRRLKDFDYSLLIAVCFLTVFGIIMIGSATRSTLTDEFVKQQIWFAFGLALLAAAVFIDYHFICKFYILIYSVCIGLLVIVLIYNKIQGNNVARWFYVGPVNIQPSEFAKIFLVIFIAKVVDKSADSINRLPVLALVLASIALPVLLVMAQPSLSASTVPLFLSLSILYVGKIHVKYIIIALGIVIPLGWLFYTDLMRPEPLILSKLIGGYQLGRLQTFINPAPSKDAIYQARNALYAIASGQLSGQGLHEGVITQLGRLPEAQTDFIFSVIGEEFGFMGCTVVLAVMLFVIIKSLIIAQRSIDFLGKLIAAGVASMFAFQVFVNVGVATSLLPNTGMPFPFVSYGGSSLWVNMVAIGLVINVGMTKSKLIFEG